MSGTAAPPTLPPPTGSVPPGRLPFVEPPPEPRRRRAWRAVLGCLIVLLASAGTSAVFVLEQVHTVVQDLKASKALKVDPRVLAPSYYGSPETLLMVGDDWRAATRYYPHAVPHLANEMLLVRIDPSKPWISMMSIPRELWVPITPPNGATYTNRLNSAYTWGATTLVQTIKQITGLSVNHVIATTFAQFETRDQHARVASTTRSTSATTTTTPTAATSTRTSICSPDISASTAATPNSSSPTATPTARRSAIPAIRASCSPSSSSTDHSWRATSARSRRSSARRSRPTPGCAARPRS